MAIDDNDRYPAEPVFSGAQSLVRNGLMQSDMDADGFRILNLDTSNLAIPGIPSHPPEAHRFLISYDGGTHLFTGAQPSFLDISGNLTTAQQQNIRRLGQIVIGEWLATPLTKNYVPSLSGLNPPTTSVNLSNQRITNLAIPINDLDAVNLETLNLRTLMGLQAKAAVAAASTGVTVLATLDHAVDGYTLNDGDRVLVKNQAADRTYEHGIYNAHDGAWTRSEDCDTAAELVGAVTFVLNGDTQATTTWIQTAPAPIKITFAGTGNPPSFSLFSTTITAQAGAGLDQTGQTIFAVGTTNRISIGTGIDISAAYVGQASITTLGTVTTGEWNATLIDGEYGGTGWDNLGKTIKLAGDFATSLGLGAPIGSFLTFTLAGSTVLNLPTTGTVATTAGDETFTNKHISADQIDTGILAINRGGTSGDTRQSALNALLPDQAGHAGHFLTTDGAGNVSWANPTGGA